MEICNAIVHLIEKERHQAPSLKLREEPLPLDNKLADLITSLRKLYNEKTARGYGVFHEDITNYPFSAKVDSYYNDGLDFLSISHIAMSILAAKVANVQLATGGYILLANYKENSQDYMIVASIKQRPGLAFDNNLNLTGAEHIDLDHLHEMARINVTSWLNGGDRYLSFAKHRGGDDGFSAYFREFIGCAEFSSSTEMNRMTLRAIKDFGDSRDIDADARRNLNARVYSYFEESRTSGKTISLETLSRRIDEDQPEAFLSFINNNSDEYPIGDGFDPVRSIYKKLKTLVMNDGSVTIRFDQEDFGTRVLLDREDNSLLIRNIKEEFIEQLLDLQ